MEMSSSFNVGSFNDHMPSEVRDRTRVENVAFGFGQTAGKIVMTWLAFNVLISSYPEVCNLTVGDSFVVHPVQSSSSFIGGEHHYKCSSQVNITIDPSVAHLNNSASFSCVGGSGIRLVQYISPAFAVIPVLRSSLKPPDGVSKSYFLVLVTSYGLSLFPDAFLFYQSLSSEAVSSSDCEESDNPGLVYVIVSLLSWAYCVGDMYSGRSVLLRATDCEDDDDAKDEDLSSCIARYIGMTLGICLVVAIGFLLPIYIIWIAWTRFSFNNSVASASAIFVTVTDVIDVVLDVFDLSIYQCPCLSA